MSNYLQDHYASIEREEKAKKKEAEEFNLWKVTKQTKMPKKKATKKKKRVNGNRKGKAAERKLTKPFSDWWNGSEFFRTPESGGMATRLSRLLGIDFSKFAGDIITLDPTFPFCVESKKVEGWRLEQMLTSDKTLMHDWWEQTINQCPKDKIPLLVFTKNHAPLYAILRREDGDLVEDGDTPFFQTWMGGGCVVIFALEHLFKTDPTGWT